MLASLEHAIRNLAILALVFVPLERLVPAWRQPVRRQGLGTDLVYFLSQNLFVWAAVAVVLTGIVRALPLGSLAPMRADFATLPVWAQVAGVLVLGDFLAYWGHRLQHGWAPLWRIHSIHHSNTHLDWLGAHREHPLDGLYTQAIVNVPAILVGFDPGAIAGLIAFRSLWAIFIHSNVRVPLGPLAYLLGSPALHHWHHDRDRAAGNYANLAPWIDVLFGTHQAPSHEPEALGIEEPLPSHYVGQLLHPFALLWASVLRAPYSAAIGKT